MASASIAKDGRQAVSLSLLIPCIILAWLVMDAGARFIPTRYLSFHAWEAARLPTAINGPFAPNFHYYNDDSYGNLANMGNYRTMRVYHPETFTTDEFGLRNTPVSVGKPVKVITVGDSFAAGDSLESDDETLAGGL